jgi:hypothetical protein
MHANRFGRKIKPPSTVAIKHQLLMMMLEDEVRAVPTGDQFKGKESIALGMLLRLKRPRKGSAH